MNLIKLIVSLARTAGILSYEGYRESLERQKEEKMTQATVNQLSEELFMLRQEIEELKRQK